MKGNQKISSRQIRSTMVTVIIGTGILSLPSKLARIQDSDGWIPIILTGLLTIFPIVIINKLFQLYPDKDFFEIGEETVGKWIFNFFLVILAINFIVSTSLVTRYLGEIIKAFLLVITPIEVIIITFILSSAYLTRSSIEVIARFGYHVYPIIIGYIIIIVLISVWQLDLTNVLPAFQSDFAQIPKSISTAFFSYTGIEILLFLLPYTEDRKGALKSSLVGTLIITIFYLLIFITTLSQYGLKSLQRQNFPTLGYAKEIDIPGFFIENLDGFIVAVWVLIIFATMAGLYFAAGKVLSYLFKTESHDLYILPLSPIIYIVSLAPTNIVSLDEQLGKLANYTGIYAMVILPLIIYIIGYYKTRRARN